MMVWFQKKQKYFIVEYKETKRSIVCEKWKNYPRECAMPIPLLHPCSTKSKAQKLSLEVFQDIDI